MSLLHLLDIRSHGPTPACQKPPPLVVINTHKLVALSRVVNNSAVAMSDITQPIATGPNHIDPRQRWYGLLPSLVGAEGDQDAPLIP